MRVADGFRRAPKALVSGPFRGPLGDSASGRAVGLGAACALACFAVLLAGCGEPASNPLGLPSLGAVAATSDSAASAGPRAGSTSSTTGRGLTATAGGYEGGASAELGRLTGSARSQREVVLAVVHYMDVRVRIANTWQVDAAALAEVATGRAARSARVRAGVMADGERRTVGVYVVNASRVRRSGDVAVVSGCMVDRTSEVDKAGQVVVDPPGGRLVTITLRRDGGNWLVSDVPTRIPAYCRAPSAPSTGSSAASSTGSSAGPSEGVGR